MWLKRLVMVLTVVMIAGFALLIGTLVAQLTADPVPVPERLLLPDDVQATAYTQGDGWAAVVTAEGRILIFDMASGALRQQVEIE